MQFLTCLLLVAATAQAHCRCHQHGCGREVLTVPDTFPRLVVNDKAEEKDWFATRETKNANTKQGIEVCSPAMNRAEL